MGFLRLDNSDIDPTKQITISLWFRVPAATMADVHAAHQELQDAYDNDETGTVRAPPANSGMIPLVTFGKRDVEIHEYPYWDYPTGDFPWTHTVVIGVHRFGEPQFLWDCNACAWIQPGGALPPNVSNIIDIANDPPTFVGDYTDKSFIGVNCRGSTPVFDFRLQYNWDESDPAILGVQKQTGYSTSPDPVPQYNYFDPSPVCNNAPFCGPDNLGTVTISGTTYYWEGHQFDYLVTQTFSEIPYASWAQKPEFFCGFPDGSRDGGQAISGDHWHHVLFSIDLSNTINTAGTQTAQENQGSPAAFAGVVNSAARCWVAIDDANKTGTELSRVTHATEGYFGGPVGPLGDGLNDLVTDYAWRTFQSYTITNYTTSNTTPGTGGGVRNDTYQGRNRPSYVFQPSGFALSPIGIPGDTDTVKVVELAELQVFTDVVVDTSDLAIRRLFVTADGAPADMEAAAETLGAVPVVRLIGLRNWQTGLNTGTAGNFERTGTISKFTPGPQLGT